MSSLKSHGRVRHRATGFGIQSLREIFDVASDGTIDKLKLVS